MESLRGGANSQTPRWMEHRWGQRIDCGSQVRISAGPGITGGGRLRNVSSSGAFVETTMSLPQNSRITLVVARHGGSGDREVETMASVVRKTAEGVGIEWCESEFRTVCGLLGCAAPCETAARHWART